MQDVQEYLADLAAELDMLADDHERDGQSALALTARDAADAIWAHVDNLGVVLRDRLTPAPAWPPAS